MWPLFQENCRYIFRSRMVFLILAFSFLVHYSGMRFLNHLTLSIQGVVSVIGPKEALYTALFLQLFTAISIASVYGIWMAPYAHRGERSMLTHVLPVSKFKFSLCYVVCCGLLLFINELVMLGTFGSIYGLGSMLREFPWERVLMTFGYQLLCLEVVMLGLAISSLVFGQVTTFFIGGTSLFIMQILGAFARLLKDRLEGGQFSISSLLLLIYQKLPPVGDFLFDLKEIVYEGKLSIQHLGIWLIWFVILNLLFWFKVRYPNQARSTEA